VSWSPLSRFFSRKILLKEGRARYEAWKGLDVEIGQEIVRSGSKDAMERIKAESRRLW